MQIDIKERVLSVVLEGELDHHMSERYRTQIDAAFEKSSCRHILVDMSGITFMDSSGIGMIIGRYKKAEMRSGKLVVTGMSKSVSKLFDMSGLAKIVSRAETKEEAMSLLGVHYE